MDVKNKRVLVVGLARSGLAVAQALARHGAVVTVSDRKPPSEFADLLPQLVKDKMGMELGSQREETFLRQDLIVTSPGVPWDLPQLAAARARSIPIYPEVEAASWFLEGTLIGITGSNGKTTTTSLLGDMLKASGFPTFVGGNIGNALSMAVDHAQPGTRFVTELSSFQLEGIRDFRPHVAVMLNLSPNHLDRHPNLEAYAQAKRQIFRNQGGQDYAVLNADDPWVAGLADTLSGQPVLFSRQRELPNGVFASRGKVVYRVRHLERVLFETRDVALKGEFNLENVLAATTAACLLGADFAAIRKAVRDFQAVEHRLEFVREFKGVDFYNNSKATSVDATAKSLEAFERGVHLILGGKDKGAPYTPLLPLIKDRVRSILLIGAAAPVIAEQLAGSTELVYAGDLSTAVREAFARARPGDTVLLAPACSSFDQFKDYEERGRVFKELVKRLKTQSEVRSPKSGVQAPSGVRSPGSGVKAGTPSEFRISDSAGSSGVSNSESGIARSQSAIPPPEGATPSGIANPESGIVQAGSKLAIPNPAPGIAPPEGATPSGIANPESGIVQAGSGPRESEANLAIKALPAAPGAGASRTPSPTTQVTMSPVQPHPAASGVAPTFGDEQPGSPAGDRDEETEPGSLRILPAAEDPETPLRPEWHYIYEVDAVETAFLEPQIVPEDEPSISISAATLYTPDDQILPFEVRARSDVRSPKSESQAGLFNGKDS
jgi:UDP-N-acetylmuramoylalanine--D-glutamate ligase